MSPSFNIQSPGTGSAGEELFIEAGPMGISFFILDTGNFFSAVVIYSFPGEMQDGALIKEIKDILKNETLLQRQYKKTHIFWSFPESILVPPGLTDPANNNEMLDLVYGDARDGVIKSDFLYKHNLHNIYRIPVEIHNSLSAQFSSAAQTHQYSLLADRKAENEFEIFAVFYTSSLTIMLRKEGRLQAIQNFSYSNPEDAAWYLLNLCKSFDIVPDSVTINISGMIDERSNLYATIYKYFLNMRFDPLPEGFSCQEKIKEHPAHFFSHLFALAACV